LTKPKRRLSSRALKTPIANFVALLAPISSIVTPHLDKIPSTSLSLIALSFTSIHSHTTPSVVIVVPSSLATHTAPVSGILLTVPAKTNPEPLYLLQEL